MDSGLKFTETGIGEIHLAGVEQPDGNRHGSFVVFLQGLPIYTNYALYDHPAYDKNLHIIHLDSVQFFARLPDREKLIDEDKIIVQVNQVIAETLASYFERIKPTIAAEVFVQYYWIMFNWNLLKLLNDVPAVPREVLQQFKSYPICDDNHGDFLAGLDKPITQDALHQREVVVIEDDMCEDGAGRYMFAWTRDSLVYSGCLDDGHWLHPLIRNLSEEEVRVETESLSNEAWFVGNWVDVNVVFCRSYRIFMGNDAVEIDDEACYLGSAKEDQIVMPCRANGSCALTQVATFANEFDDFQESAFNSDCEAFHAFVVANTTAEPADALKALLPNFSGCASLFGKSFRVEINEEGKVAAVLAA